MLTLLFAGHDTSATTLTQVFWHLHSHPEAEARLRAEQVVRGMILVDQTACCCCCLLHAVGFSSLEASPMALSNTHFSVGRRRCWPGTVPS